VGEIKEEEKANRGEDESSTAALVNEQRMEGTAMSKKTIRSPTVAEMRNESRWRQTVQGAVQFLNSQGKWETRFWIRPTSIGVAGAGLGLYAAQDYKARQSIVVYVGEDMKEVTNPPPVDTMARQSEPVMAVGGRLIDGLHGVTGAQYSNAAYHLPNKQTNNAKFTNTGTINTTKNIKIGREMLMAYWGELWAGEKRAQQWRQAHPQEAQGSVGRLRRGTGTWRYKNMMYL
jgi:hypothetical protein